MPMIGARIREMRLNHGWTLEQVSNETGLSVSFLSMLERDKVSVSVDNLDKLARFMGVRMMQFFQGIEGDDLLVTRAAQADERAAKLQPDASIFLLLSRRGNARMEPLLVTIAPGHGDPRFRSHDGDTLLYVLAGSVRLLTEGGEAVTLQTHDSAYYYGFPARRIENASAEEQAQILLVTTPPTSMRDDAADANRGVLIQSEE